MLVQLNAVSRSNEDAVALLLDCHERIRRFCAMALKLAVAINEDPELIRDAAARVHRYFSVALPLHVEDEELSIRPRLDVTASDAVRAALQKMSQDHEHIDSLLAALLPIWHEIQCEPTSLVSHHEHLESATRTFQLLMSEHLELEETMIFPTLRQTLSVQTLDTVKREMQARRQPPQTSTTG